MRVEASEPLLVVRELSVDYRVHGRMVRVVEDVSFTIDRRETVALVGESGSGKTTTGRAVLRRLQPASGSVVFEGRDLSALSHNELRAARARLQMVFQDPFASLNPRMTVGELVGEPLLVHGIIRDKTGRRGRVRELLERCGLPQDAADRYPDAFSGGQRQRIGIARALALSPRLIVADEPVSSLDVSVQAQIINLLMSVQREEGVAYLFISHDLAVVRHISDRVLVMYAGRIVESAATDSLFDQPLHPYTRALLAAAPIPDPVAERRRERIVTAGEAPDPANPLRGCRFQTSCPLVHDRCRVESPVMRERLPGHAVACWHE